MKQAQVDGLLVEQSPTFIFQAKKLVELAAKAKVPAIYPFSIYDQLALPKADRTEPREGVLVVKI